MKISKDIASTLEVEFGDEFHPAYSGRAMYGKTCIGIVTDGFSSLRNFVQVLAAAIAEERFDGEYDADDIENIVDDIGDPSTDSMGLSTIYYWTQIEVQ